MKAIVIDDEGPALDSLTRLLERNGIDVAGSFRDPREALKQQGSLRFDVAFVDIEMPELNGLELAARLQTSKPDLQIVFVTAYEQYAVEAFELDAADYLLKPVQLGRLDMTLKRLRAAARGGSSDEGKASLHTICLLQRLGFHDAQGSLLDIQWRTAKARELFAYLVHCGDRSPSKDELIDTLWPDGDVDKAATLLHTSLYHIRQTMKNANFPLKVEYKEGRYRLVLPQMTGIDASQWEQAVAVAAEVGDADKWQELLLEGYRGDYLEAESFLWAEPERERVRALWLEGALRLAGSFEAKASASGGESAKAIAIYQKVQSRFPEIEDSYFGLMRHYDALGQSSEVYHQYANLVRMLGDEFGMRPKPDIQAWFDEWYTGRLA
ncbi:response regulator [Cohnella suwonensis]|uniref:Response regulator n=1 Tax=Cohnella suwonensis TaxID=696072 RepID=A0ABW0LZF2_9BACL